MPRAAWLKCPLNNLQRLLCAWVDGSAKNRWCPIPLLGRGLNRRRSVFYIVQALLQKPSNGQERLALSLFYSTWVTLGVYKGWDWNQPWLMFFFLEYKMNLSLFRTEMLKGCLLVQSAALIFGIILVLFLLLLLAKLGSHTKWSGGFAMQSTDLRGPVICKPIIVTIFILRCSSLSSTWHRYKSTSYTTDCCTPNAYSCRAAFKLQRETPEGIPVWEPEISSHLLSFPSSSWAQSRLETSCVPEL